MCSLEQSRPLRCVSVQAQIRQHKPGEQVPASREALKMGLSTACGFLSVRLLSLDILYSLISPFFLDNSYFVKKGFSHLGASGCLRLRLLLRVFEA